MKPLQKLVFVSVMTVVANTSCAQETISLNGRVFSENEEVMATHVLNTSSNKATITDADGFFDIDVQLNDTLVFSAIQFKRKEVVVTKSILESRLLVVPLQQVLNQLEEVVVMPYNLTGDMSRDLNRIPVGSIITSQSLGLENKKGRLRPKGVGEKLRINKYLDLVTGYDTVTLKPKFRLDLKIVRLSEDISGRTKELKRYATLENENKQLEEIRLFFTDFVFIETLKIPEHQIPDFLNYCMVDADFKELANANEMSALYELLETKGQLYRKNNNLD
ncbi:carboxypeptidase-like regulatory domain-containing protein [Zobellia sp. 1_MG-2023]|uniref:carboxypeptidase-like regulatory domain-containing protein n=1 Tax=Zobellia sp. 1_MG-2023 TaxID=3062626 RepID=UPI0026E1E2C6|nr:carboxypeptidase-like regulatory domain-containing protein [Zobellia sp. 1_MG-2023]MDO6820039.1 carboxypeptidase-like regulatory domain-containing protein [Zobellia sp. 1_MG-2023]